MNRSTKRASAANGLRFEALYKNHYADVFAYVARRATPDLVHDVVAETFVVAWRRIDRVPDEPLPWLLAVARKTLANQRRSATRRERLVHRLAAESATAAPPSPAGADFETSDMLQALARLPDGDREILTVIAWEGLSPEEAARVLGITKVAARVRLHRARQRLRKEIERLQQHQQSAALAPEDMGHGS